MIIINNRVNILIIGLEILKKVNKIIEINQQFLIEIRLDILEFLNHIF
jgi:hypothetical protein